MYSIDGKYVMDRWESLDVGTLPRYGVLRRYAR